ncbi:alpha/beta fold hydrolase [Pseudomonas chlororaphis]|uniref:AB hydrolase-1 domain-containing protein n=1 Tax=Pseudomonas chlororaphis TaxID=587753 RepID=A0A1Q8EQ72_9PSED|nr:alpha/beta hydrolase [Pseudomonas chlororaphis]OLF53916.1 hypothetical protein BTN82_12710 [Pseudomonas chlororaphis]
MSEISISKNAVKNTVVIGNVEVTCYDSGKATTNVTAERPPIVLVHGTGGSASSHFGFLFPMLELNQRVVALNFTRPLEQDELTLADLEAQIVGIIDKVLPGVPVTLVGYSLGAVAAASVAAHRPDLVGNLVLVAGWVKTDPQQELRNAVWRQLYQAKLPAIREFTAYCGFSPRFFNYATPAQITTMLAAINPGEFDELQMALNRSIDLTASIGNIQATTLIVGCTYDTMVPIQHSKRLFGSIIDARFVEIESGHAVVYERPAQLCQIIDQFNEMPTRYPAGSILPAQYP